MDENEYWLISNETVETIRKRITDSKNTYGEHQEKQLNEALMHLDTGLHKCGVKPYDM